ncbi:MAG TPA: glycosyltransferase [Nitrospirota bacterium]|nr:glycosyltransferase [Nitrospirota bacterium]
MKVSVAIVTYNHEKYLAKALDSVLMQRTGFDFEIVVGEDHSTDKTREILVDYQQKHPQKFRIFLNETNMGMYRNGAQVLEACSGEYIAMLDGDDYWTSPDKLQKQVDFLDAHADCAICYHNARIVYEDGSREPTSYRPRQKQFSTVNDLFLDNFIPTCAVLFRNGLFGRLPAWVGALKMGDWLIHILNALHGRIGYLDETMAVYVVHGGGIWSTKTWQDHEPAMIRMFEALSEHMDSRYAGILAHILRWRYFELSQRYEQIGDLARAGACASEALKKHALIVSRPMKYGRWSDPEALNILPPYVYSPTGAILLRSMVRLYVIPFLRSHFNPLYRLLRAVARKLKLGL